MEERIEVQTKGRLILRDENKYIIKQVEISNLLTTIGRRWVLQRMLGVSSATLATLQLGSSNTTPTKLDTGVTTLVTSIPVTIYEDLTNNKFTVLATIPQGLLVGTTFREASLILSDAACFNHSVFADFVKTGAQVDVEWDIIYN